QISAANPEQSHDAQSPQHGRADYPGKLASVLDIAPDDEPVAARQSKHVGKSESRLSAALRRAAIFELDRPQAVRQLLRDAGEIAGDTVSFRIGDVIEAAARGLASIRYGAHELGQAAVGVLLGKALELGVDRIVQLAGQQYGGIPIDIEDGHHRRRAEQGKISHRQAKGRGAKELSERRHGWYSRRRGPCAATASQSSCRSLT